MARNTLHVFFRRKLIKHKMRIPWKRLEIFAFETSQYPHESTSICTLKTILKTFSSIDLGGSIEKIFFIFRNSLTKNYSEVFKEASLDFFFKVSTQKVLSSREISIKWSFIQIGQNELLWENCCLYFSVSSQCKWS